MNKYIGPHKIQYLFLDLNSYFASVEQQENPHLRGKPVVVVPVETDNSCVIAASYEAKSYGIQTGTAIWEAKKLCPSLQCVLARHDVYVDYHHKIFSAIESCLPINKKWSIDELDCLLLGEEQNYESAYSIALKIKKCIWQDIGSSINCSIGIASNSFLAKVATEIEKPNGLVIIQNSDLPSKLLSLSLKDLPGINTAMEKRLKKAGVHSIQNLWDTSPKQARSIWGSVQGERFWYWLHGYNIPYQQTKPSMIGHSRVLDPALRTANKSRQVTRRLLFKASCRLRRKKFYAGKLSLTIRFTNKYRWSGEQTFPYTKDPFILLKYLDELWLQMLSNTPYLYKEMKLNTPIIKKVSTILQSLRTQEEITDDLFQNYIAQHSFNSEKNENLIRAIEELQNKYKKEIICLGFPPKTSAGYTGTKIAFSRIPDKQEFWS